MIAYFLTIAITIVIFLASPLINFAVGWILGWITSLIIGNFIVTGLSYFNIIIETNQIPLIFGVFVMIIGLIRTTFSNFNKEEKDK